MNHLLSNYNTQFCTQLPITKEFVSSQHSLSPLKKPKNLNEFKEKSDSVAFYSKYSPSTRPSVDKASQVESRRVLRTPEKNTNYLFKPVINQRSQKMMSKLKKNSQNCWENLYEDSFYKKNKIDVARKQGIEDEFKNKDFTFHPLIISRNKSSTDLVTRTYSWLKQKNQKISSKIEEETDKDLQGCTFMPEIHEFKDEGTEVLRNIKGVGRFLERKKVNRNESPQKSASRAKNISVKEYEEAVKDLSSYLHSFEISYFDLHKN